MIVIISNQTQMLGQFITYMHIYNNICIHYYYYSNKNPCITFDWYEEKYIKNAWKIKYDFMVFLKTEISQ